MTCCEHPAMYTGFDWLIDTPGQQTLLVRQSDTLFRSETEAGRGTYELDTSTGTLTFAADDGSSTDPPAINEGLPSTTWQVVSGQWVDPARANRFVLAGPGHPCHPECFCARPTNLPVITCEGAGEFFNEDHPTNSQSSGTFFRRFQPVIDQSQGCIDGLGRVWPGEIPPEVQWEEFAFGTWTVRTGYGTLDADGLPEAVQLDAGVGRVLPRKQECYHIIQPAAVDDNGRVQFQHTPFNSPEIFRVQLVDESEWRRSTAVEYSGGLDGQGSVFFHESLPPVTITARICGVMSTISRFVRRLGDTGPGQQHEFTEMQLTHQRLQANGVDIYPNNNRFQVSNYDLRGTTLDLPFWSVFLSGGQWRCSGLMHPYRARFPAWAWTDPRVRTVIVNGEAWWDTGPPEACVRNQDAVGLSGSYDVTPQEPAYVTLFDGTLANQGVSVQSTEYPTTYETLLPMHGGPSACENFNVLNFEPSDPFETDYRVGGRLATNIPRHGVPGGSVQVGNGWVGVTSPWARQEQHSTEQPYSQMPFDCSYRTYGFDHVIGDGTRSVRSSGYSSQYRPSAFFLTSNEAIEWTIPMALSLILDNGGSYEFNVADYPELESQKFAHQDAGGPVLEGMGVATLVPNPNDPNNFCGPEQVAEDDGDLFPAESDFLIGEMQTMEMAIEW